MRVFNLLLLISMFIPFPLPAQVGERYIEVTGTSEIEVVPDRIHYVIEIREYFEEEFDGVSKPEEYRTKVPLTRIEEELKQVLKIVGVPREAIRTKDVGDNWRKPGQDFLVSKSFDVTLRDFTLIDEILKRVDKADTVLIGPGLGRCDDVSEVVESVLEYSKVPVIIDADGINAVAENMKALSSCTCPVIFTPHTVEMSRLTGLEREYIEDNRLVTAKEFAEENGVTLILKGHHTIVTGQDGEQYINITGNSGLATGGSGDVLAGTVASLVSRGINETVASAMAVYIHGLAGDIAKDKYGIESVTASKVMECIPCALRQILQVEN